MFLLTFSLMRLRSVLSLTLSPTTFVMSFKSSSFNIRSVSGVVIPAARTKKKKKKLLKGRFFMGFIIHTQLHTDAHLDFLIYIRSVKLQVGIGKDFEKYQHNGRKNC